MDGAVTELVATGREAGEASAARPKRADAGGTERAARDLFWSGVMNAILDGLQAVPAGAPALGAALPVYRSVRPALEVQLGRALDVVRARCEMLEAEAATWRANAETLAERLDQAEGRLLEHGTSAAHPMQALAGISSAGASLLDPGLAPDLARAVREIAGAVTPDMLALPIPRAVRVVLDDLVALAAESELPSIAFEWQAGAVEEAFGE